MSDPREALHPPVEQPPGDESPGAAPLFDARTRRWLLPAAAVTVAITLIAALLVKPPEPEVAGPTAYSQSALGYEALAASLDDAGFRVVVSRWRSGLKANAEVPVLILEPQAEHRDEIQEIFTHADRRGAPVILGLPKWEGVTRGAWERVVAPLDLEQVNSHAWSALPDIYGIPVRRDDEYAPELDWRASFALPADPDLIYPQLLDARAPSVTPIIWAEGAGTLVARLPGGRYVLADPDLWSTHGLAKPGNAAIVEALLREEFDARGVVIDEVVHGFEQAPSIWRELLSWPIWPFTAHLLGLAVLALWGAMPRFGAPVPPPPRVAPGVAALIENTARLLNFGGYLAYTVQRYTKTAIRESARTAGLPAGTPLDQQLTRLDALSTARGLSATPSALWRLADALPERKCKPRRALLVARRVYTWREEMRRA